MKVLDRYASAVHSSNLKVNERTTYSDSDVLGAVGFAGKVMRCADSDRSRPGAPLAMALQRLFSGDNHAAREIVELMTEAVWGKAFSEEIKLKRTEAEDMAKAVLAWHRDGICKPCGGHGYELIPGTPYMSERECPVCKGTRKVLLHKQFRQLERLGLARWLLGELEAEMCKAGPAAMAALAPRLDL